MKKFEFRLSNVLRVREVQLQAERTKLAQHQGRKQQVAAALETLLNERRSAVQALHISEAMTAADLRCTAAFLVGAEAKATALRDQLQRTAILVQEQQERVISAERNVRLLEKLRQKQEEQWTKQVDRDLEILAQEAWCATHLD
jgi:flagellar export protein FliJ